MGLSSKKTKTTQINKPIYSKEIEGAASNLASTYAGQAPKIQGYADSIGDLSGGLIERFKEGDPTVRAGQAHIQNILGGDGSNPFLDDMIDITNDRVRNQTQAAMGTRGQTGGSGYADIISRNLANNETGMRYNDYSQDQARRMQAAGMAPGLAAAEYIPLAPAMETANFGASLPMDAALKNAAGVGGLLGQYQKVKGEQKQSGGFLGDLLGSALMAGGSYFGGGG